MATGSRVPPKLRNWRENKMRKSLIAWGFGALIVVAASSVGLAQKAKKVIYVSSSDATFKPAPMEGVSIATLRGDPDKGAHATFTKFAAGHDAEMHTHTNVVV